MIWVLEEWLVVKESDVKFKDEVLKEVIEDFVRDEWIFVEKVVLNVLYCVYLYSRELYVIVWLCFNVNIIFFYI